MTAFRTAAVLATVLLAGPAFAQGSMSQMKPAKSAPAARPATAAVHATTGVVKSIDASTLVITKSAAKGPETSFVLNTTTQREGAIAPGTSVDVRYRDEGKTKVATAISLHAPKSSTSAKSKPSK